MEINYKLTSGNWRMEDELPISTQRSLDTLRGPFFDLIL